jgi:hypothetical protein
MGKGSMNTIVKLLGFALIALIFAAPAHSQGYRQFVTAGSQGDQQGPVGPNIIRQRGVTLDFGALTQSVSAPSSFMQIAFFDDAVYTVEILRTETTHSGGIAYVGRVAENPMSPVVIVDNGGVISVLLAVGEKRFAMQGTPGIGYVARELADHGRPDHPATAFNVEGIKNIVPGAAQGDPVNTTPPEIARDDGSTIDIMVVYTQAARSANGGTAQMNTNVDAQITLTNTIYANSNVVQRLRLVYKGEVNYTEVNMDTDLPRITNSDGFMDDVLTLRDIYAADFVSLWGVYNDYCGLGWLMATEQASFASLGYNVTASPSCTGSGSYTFAHELGHNMGLRHDNYVDTTANTNVTPEAGGAAVNITYAHGYIDLTNRFRTVMSYNDQCVASGFNCTRIPHFSNPSINFNNSASYPSAVLATTGNATNAHERQALNDTRDTTANFRQGHVSLSGPGIVAFIPSSYTVAEGGASVQLTVTRHVGSTGAIGVSYTTTNGTATAGSDYTTTSGTLSWANGDTAAKTITVNISQDAILEGNETFTVTLNTPTGGASIGSSGGTSQSATVTITDDEPDTFPAGGVIPAGYVTPGTSPGAWTVDSTQGYLSPQSLRSAQVYGDMTNYTNSDLEYTGNFVAGNVTFAYKVSSYPNYGRFDFMIDGVTVLTNAGGEVAFTPTSHAITAGTHTLRWRFRNRISFACASASPAPPGGSNCADRAWVDGIVLPLALPSTTTSLGSSLNPSTLGASVTFTATVTSGSGTPTGTVNFKDGGTSIGGCGSVSLSSGSAQCATSALAQGSRSITAEYSGSGSHAASTSSTLTQTVNAAVAKRSDFDGGGTSDILWYNSTTGMLYELQMNGMTTGTAAVIDTRADLNWKVVAVADINGDGRADVVWQNNATGVVQGLIMNGTTVTSSGTIYTEPNTNWKVVGAGDFNGDGRADLLWKNNATGDVFLLLLNGLTPTGGGVVYSEPNTNWVIQQVADFDGNNRADILWRNVATGDVYMMLMNGTTVASGAVFYSEPNTNWQIQQAADFDGDGRADILWRNVTTGDVYMMFMNGTSLAGGSVFYGEPNTAWKIVAAGDYNGNGRADILWRNTTTGQVFMMLMNGATIVQGDFVYTEPNQDWKILP